MHISMISCIDREHGIGYKNNLLYKLPNDLKRFKEKTLNKVVICGKATYYTLPKLKDRTLIVISKELHETVGNTMGVRIFPKLRKCLETLQKEDVHEVVIIGGEGLYREALPISHTIYLTQVHHKARHKDRYFPIIPTWQFLLTEETRFEKDDLHKYPYTFKTYQRKYHANDLPPQ